MSHAPSRRDFLRQAGATVAFGALGRARQEAPTDAVPRKRPNLLFVFSDQQHWHAAGFLDRSFTTPNFDRLAAEGAVFENAFCTSPQCSPSRSTILTGLYPSKTGVLSNIGGTGTRPLAMATIAPSLRAAGYRTAYFGKWHLGGEAAGSAGWDEDAGIIAADPATDRDAAERAAAFLASAKADAKPFVLFVSFKDPHDIYDFDPAAAAAPTEPDEVALPDSWERARFDDRPSPQRAFMESDRRGKIMKELGPAAWKAYRRFYRGKVRAYDANLGTVLDALRASGLADSTVVVATTDHGDMDGAHRLVFKGPFMYEELVHIPLVVRVPAAFGGRAARSSALVVNADVAPTLLDFAGADAPRDVARSKRGEERSRRRRFDGVSLEPWLTGRGPEPARDFIVGQYYGKRQWVVPIRMVRTREWKYVTYVDYGEELYDLSRDPGEIVNLASDGSHAAVKRELGAKLDEWLLANDDPFRTLKPAGSAADADESDR